VAAKVAAKVGAKVTVKDLSPARASNVGIRIIGPTSAQNVVERAVAVVAGATGVTEMRDEATTTGDGATTTGGEATMTVPTVGPQYAGAGPSHGPHLHTGSASGPAPRPPGGTGIAGDLGTDPLHGADLQPGISKETVVVSEAAMRITNSGQVAHTAQRIQAVWPSPCST